MNEQSAKTAILLAGRRVTFWQFLLNVAVAYGVAVLAMLLGGPLGMGASMLIGTAMTAMLLYGLVLFGLQRPGTTILLVVLLAAIHISMLQARIPGGLLWPIWSKAGLHWLEAHGF
jgi:hypothetical protein